MPCAWILLSPDNNLLKSLLGNEIKHQNKQQQHKQANKQKHKNKQITTKNTFNGQSNHIFKGKLSIVVLAVISLKWEIQVSQVQSVSQPHSHLEEVSKFMPRCLQLHPTCLRFYKEEISWFVIILRYNISLYISLPISFWKKKSM